MAHKKHSHHEDMHEEKHHSKKKSAHNPTALKNKMSHVEKTKPPMHKSKAPRSR
jgi:hypothetical protein